MWFQILQKLVKKIDPKLEKYREKKPAAPQPKWRPESLEEFVDLVRRTPKSVLSEQDRARIAAVMSFDDRKVADLMAPRGKMVFVKSSEILGPLTLDKLYKSGFTDFPVVDAREKVVGVIHTEALNALEIRKTDKAEKYIDKNVNYLHAGDSLRFAVEEILRRHGNFFLVLDAEENLAGFFTLEMVLDYLLG